MMLIMGQSNRVWHYWAGKFPGSVGVMTAPSYGAKVPLDPWMPFVLDNDAFTCWRDNKPWVEDAWFGFINRIKATGMRPVWCAVPDVVADRERTIANWPRYVGEVKRRGWDAAFCVQDGMTEGDVPDDADVVFVGGSDAWKFPNLRRWVDNYSRVHCARVNSPAMIERCEELGCESVDGTGWFRDPSRQDKVPMLRRFIEGHRARKQQLQLI